jgi:hypothetical protein
MYISGRTLYISKEENLRYWLVRNFIKYFKIGWELRKLGLDEVFSWEHKFKGYLENERTLKQRSKPKILTLKKFLILNDNVDENSAWNLFWMDIIQNFEALQLLIHISDLGL